MELIFEAVAIRPDFCWFSVELVSCDSSFKLENDFPKLSGCLSQVVLQVLFHSHDKALKIKSQKSDVHVATKLSFEELFTQEEENTSCASSCM